MAEPLHRDPIPFITLPNWIKAANKCGFSIEPVFREVGIATDLVHLESATISAPLLQQVMEACVQRSPSVHFPFVLGETFAFDYLPEIETFLATSPTLREGLRVFDWVRELINPMIDVQLVEEGTEARLVLAALDPDAKPYFSETTFASIIKFGRVLLGANAHFQHLCFHHPAPPHAAAYGEFFGVPVYFDQPRHLLAFERALLDRPLGGAFPALHRQAEYRVERRLQNLPKKSGLIAEVEQVFIDRPDLLGQGIDRLAAALPMHARTLQRRLRDEGLSFGELQDRARSRLAQQWLHDREVNLETISERLGFSDRRSFTRAFTRWTGLSPSVFRSK